MADAEPYYPPGAFYFQVSILGSSGNSQDAPAIDASFQEVSGLDREMEYEEVREGGENRFVHRLPKRGRHPNLVLKRGLVTIDSALATWAEATLTSTLTRPIELKRVQVMLLGAEAQPLVTWTVNQAYPAKWVVAPFNATEGQIAVETFELAYTWVERKLGSGGGRSVRAARNR